MARDVIKFDDNQQVLALAGATPDTVETVIIQPSDETIPREYPANLSALLDIIDSMPADMLSDLHGGLPQERDKL